MAWQNALRMAATTTKPPGQFAPQTRREPACSPMTRRTKSYFCMTLLRAAGRTYRLGLRWRGGCGARSLSAVCAGRQIDRIEANGLFRCERIVDDLRSPAQVDHGGSPGVLRSLLAALQSTYS